jgi:uncharacterized protein YqjF (DUF2071 family)
VLAQTWRRLAFLHWRLPASALRPLVPAVLELETFDGSAWLGIVPFEMAWVRPRWLPPVPGLSFFPELNVRTYVRHADRPGVWFLSLDAGSRIAVRAARRFFHLPYFDADMRLDGSSDDGASLRSTRTDERAPPAAFDATWRPIGDRMRGKPGGLEHFLTERYCLYATDAHGRLLRADVHHEPWTLRPAACDIRVNTLFDAHGLAPSPEAPLLHVADAVTVPTWLLESVDTATNA